MCIRDRSKASGAETGLIAFSCSLVSTPTEVPVCSAVAGVAVAETTTVCGVVASFNSTVSDCVCGRETCSDCSANPGASTTRRYCPSARCGNVAVPSPAVVCTPTPALSPMRNKLTCTPETRPPAGLSTDTLKSDARAAVQHSSAMRNPQTMVKRRTLDMTLFLYTRKGLVIRAPHRTQNQRVPGTRSSRRSPGLRVAICIADDGGGLPVGTVADPPKTRLQLRGSAGFTPASQFRR